MKGWIIYNHDPHDVYEMDRLIEEAKKVNINIEVYDPSDFEIFINREDKKSILIKNERKELPDFFWSRTGAGTTYYGLTVIRHLERLGIPCINVADAIDTVKDKFYTLQILSQCNISIPKTLFVRYPVNIDNVEKILGFPCVLKVISGSQGKGVYLCNNKKELINYLDIIDTSSQKSNFIIQEFVKDSYGKDVRVYVIGGRIIGAMKRQSADELDFRANITNGGIGEKHEITENMEMIVLESVKAVGLDIAGVDLLFDGESFKVCEINSNPGFKGFEKYTGINVPEKIINYIKFKLK